MSLFTPFIIGFWFLLAGWLLKRRALRKQEMYLRDSGFVRVKPRKPSPPFSTRTRDKARR